MVKIMVIDDDKLVTDLLQKILGFEGFGIVTTNDSSKAIDLAKSEQPDLFLLDLMMPQPDGFRLCRMIREEPALCNTPIIMITALDDNDSRNVAFGAGATDYITKPFHPDEVINRIGELLEAPKEGVPLKEDVPLNEFTKTSLLRNRKKELPDINIAPSRSLIFFKENILLLTFFLLIIFFCALLEILN